MGIAFVSRLRRPLGLVLVPALLVACSGSGLVPPGEIDGAGVGAIPAREARRTETVAKAAPVEEQSLPMIDSDEALGLGGNPGGNPGGSAAAGGALAIPEGGVGMDEGLGVGRVQGLAEAQAQEIAEGNASQVVVDGIGSDMPRQVGDPIPMSEAGAEMGEDAGYLRVPAKASAGEGASLREGRRVPLVEQEREVAFLPRAGNPMTVPQAGGAMPAAEQACRQRLRQLGVTFRDLPRISRGRSCGIEWPVELSGLSGGIQIKPAAQVNCQITEAFARWVKQELVPSARTRYFSGVAAIHQMSSYSCRTMNSRKGAAMSEHAKGNAIDVGKIVLKSGKAIAIEPKGFFAFREKGLLKSVRGDSCKYFSTVLGPGSDRYHKDHFHFDLRVRKSGYRHCSL